MQMVPLHRPELAAWARERFEPWTRRPGPAAFAWAVLRSRAVVTASEPGPLMPAAEAALERAPGSMDALFVSMTGGRASKLLCFVFDRDSGSPAAVAKAIPDPRFDEGLRREVRVLDELRRRELPPDVATALPPAPIATRTVGGDFVVVDPVETLTPAVGDEDRAGALAWLERFHRATTSAARDWSAGDTERLLAGVRYGWERARPAETDQVVSRVERLSGVLHGVTVDRCTVHGDFWEGNIAARDGVLRIFDWEWAGHDAAPFLDLWTYELAPLVEQALPDPELLDALSSASGAVRSGLAARGLPERFALVTLAPALAELAFRFRRERGVGGGSETRLARMMPAVERLLEAEAGNAR